MMLCCMIAALILAQIVAVVRRWGIFWGVVTPHEWENPETVFNRVSTWFAIPRVRRAVFAMAAAEFAVLGGWVYLAHGTHIYQLGDQTLGILRGERIVYADLCGSDGKDRTVRIVVNRAMQSKRLADAT